MSILNGLQTRADFDRKIQELENDLAELKANRPRAVQKFYLFRGTPFRSCMIYASDQETARQKMLDRYAETYGLESLTIHGRCEVFDDAERANINCGWSCGLMTCLTKDDALAFIQDWKVDHPAVAPSKPRRVSTLERDIRAFEDSHSRERALAET